MDDQMNNNGPVQYEPTQYKPTGPIENDNDNYATAILVLGILSICCCAPCGIVSLVLRASYKDSISPDKQGMVTAGFVTSIIGIALWGISLVCYIFFAALSISIL